MKKTYIFSIILYVILVHVVELQARDLHVQAHVRYDQPQQDPYNFNTPQNSGYSSSYSSNESFEYKQALHHRSGSITIAHHEYPVTRDDFDLIQKICLDNPHKNTDELWKMLLQSSILNEAAILMKNYQQLHCFTSDIYINPKHFRQLVNAQQRLNLLKQSADNAMNHRHALEKNNLTAQHKVELKAAKKISNKEKDQVALGHKKEWADIDARHKHEKKHPLGVKQPQKSVVELLQSQSKSQVTQQASPQQVIKKSKIGSQEIQKLKECNNNHVLKINHEARSTVFCNQNDLFQQIIDQRSKAFDQSLQNSTPTTEHIKINAQTADFLQAQGIDSIQFQQIEGLPIQHQLTHELVDILDAVADYAQHHQYEIYQTHLTQYCAHLASLSQQSNLEGALQQAIEGTNCCHGVEHYLTGMVSGGAQAYQQFQTALDYFDTVTDSYRVLVAQHAAQGAVATYGLEAIVAAGMIAAPTATFAATGMMIGAAVYVMAPLCFQAAINLKNFGCACILGNWNKVALDLHNFGTFISSKETVTRMAELAGGAAMPTPNLNCVVEQVLSLRPVIASVQNASGEMVQSLYLITKNQLQKVYTQGVELLQLPEFVNFNLVWEQNWGCHFFDILPKSHPALAGAFSGLEVCAMNSVEQIALTSLFTQAEELVIGDIVKSGVSSIGSQAVQVIEQAVESLIVEQARSIAQLHEILQHEIIQSLQQPIISTDLTVKITDAKYLELRELIPLIRQLQDLAKYTDNFKNLENLIVEDICYLNRVYELQAYRAQIKNFLDTYKPYFRYEGQTYFIEDIASYHIHAADYFRKNAPRGGHSNYGGDKLDHFKPTINKQSSLGVKEVVFYNSRFIDEIKESSIYPEIWSEYMCDLKAIEVIMSGKANLEIDLVKGVINFEGYTPEGIKIRIGYDIKAKRIKTHYPKLD